jgi:hypothetical protein
MAGYEIAPRVVQPATARRRNGTSGRPKSDDGFLLPPSPLIRVVARSQDGAAGTRARILVTMRNGAEVEITRTVVAAIAHALWEAGGEDHLTNWLDAEAVFNQFVPGSGNGSGAVPRSAPAGRRDDDDAMPDILPRRRSRRL